MKRKARAGEGFGGKAALGESLSSEGLPAEISSGLGTTERPWGSFKTTASNPFYQSKILEIRPLASISLQRHQFREEYWIAAFGQGEAQIGDSRIALSPGSFVFVPKACKHRLRNLSENQALIVVEVQLGESFDEDDIERIEDEYGR
jgi:mannose-1-phosphate guanylyltransferase/mannose-6-phosphate isomerase